MKKFKIYVISLLSMLFLHTFTIRAADVPQAIKYQAVIRDLNGQVMAERNGIDIKINIRLQNETGPVVYSEFHTNLQSNPYGMIHLEIGRGEKTDVSLAFDQIDWGAGSHYVQVEVQIDGQGFTQMGMAELLSVPYALYAANSGSGETDLSTLQHNTIPKYDTVAKTLVNTTISQDQGGNILLKGPSITFYNPAQGAMGSYTFPSRAGVNGQVLVAKDDKGTIGWGDVQGGGGGGGADVRLDGLNPTFYPYWDGTINRLVDGKIKQEDNFNTSMTSYLTLDSGISVKNDAKFLQNIHTEGNISIGNNLSVDNNLQVTGTDIALGVNGGTSQLVFNGDITTNGSNSQTGDFILNGTLSGTNNIMINELTKGKFWVGNASDKAIETAYKFPLTAAPNSFLFLGVSTKTDSLVWRSLITKGNIRINKDTVTVLPNAALRLSLYAGNAISLDSAGVSVSNVPLTNYMGVWKSKNDTVYNNGDLSKVCVAIGSTSPKAKLHLQDGSMFIDKGSLISTSVLNPAAPTLVNGSGVRMMWYGEKAALRVGEVDADQWDALNVGTHSFAFGHNTKAGDYAFAGGEGAIAQRYGFASGYRSEAGVEAIAMGNANIAKDSSVAIGMGNTTDVSSTMALGYFNTVSAPAAFALGKSIKIERTAINTSFGIGLNNKIQSPSSLAIGRDIKVNGTAVTDKEKIVIGHNITVDASGGAIAIGSGSTSAAYHMNAATNGIGIGKDVKVLANYGIALGWKASTSTASSIAIGNGADVLDGANSIAIGKNNTIDAGGGTSVALGVELSTESPSSINIGRNNSMLGGASIAIGRYIVEQDQENTITIGNGLNTSNIKNCVILGYAGGSGTRPVEISKLLADGNLLASGDFPSLVVLGGITPPHATFNAITLLGTQKGDLKIPGDLYAAGNKFTSDLRLKENIQPLIANISFLDSILPVSYNFISAPDKQAELGFIAQDVQRYFPSLVSESGGFLYLNYTGLIPVLWKYTQEQQKRIASQQAQINALQSQIDAINTTLQELKNSK